MSLQSCRVCGYALSTTTMKCRHCSASHDDASRAGAWHNKYGNKIVGWLWKAITVGFGVYLFVHFQRGGAF